ncbi:hypothetical protein HQ36_08815 [Porphyromonas gingivicanis]|uniref:Uncharacterized protein n=1 Tax=Porphyromonas gingivicanis TaxID=266762 RepID=A0A0A2G1E5_9PORP|nr:hypothetical protein HQ36_08815 [Porphyromonas gingivicanis]
MLLFWLHLNYIYIFTYYGIQSKCILPNYPTDRYNPLESLDEPFGTKPLKLSKQRINGFE